MFSLMSLSRVLWKDARAHWIPTLNRDPHSLHSQSQLIPFDIYNNITSRKCGRNGAKLIKNSHEPQPTWGGTERTQAVRCCTIRGHRDKLRSQWTSQEWILVQGAVQGNHKNVILSFWDTLTHTQTHTYIIKKQQQQHQTHFFNLFFHSRLHVLKHFFTGWLLGLLNNKETRITPQH